MLALLFGGSCLGRLAAQTGTFIDRHLATDLRVVTYNVYLTKIFPDVDPTQAEKFVRVVNALNPDILNLQEVNRPAADVVALMDSIAPLASGSWHVHKGATAMIVSKYPLSMQVTSIDPFNTRPLAIALVDLPDDQFELDFYVMNSHFLCCGIPGGKNLQRQREADAVVRWIRDVRTPGGAVDLPQGTPIAALGDLNIVGNMDPLNTMVTGDIFDESRYGRDAPPDWDRTPLTDPRPLHNGSGPDDYTYRQDGSIYGLPRLDYILYTDSVLDVGNKFVLNTVDMSFNELSATGLQTYDITVDSTGANYDHLPVVVDFRMAPVLFADFNGDGAVNGADLRQWEISYLGPLYDLNSDDQVSGADFLKWQRSHVTDPPTFDESPANLDQKGLVDSDDIRIWEQSYGIDDVADLDSDGDADGFDFLELQREFTPYAVADKNLDRRVDGQDLSIWEEVFGYEGVVDANFDGVANGLDFLIWQRESSNALSSLAQPVPEPSSSLLLTGLVAIATLTASRWASFTSSYPANRL